MLKPTKILLLFIILQCAIFAQSQLLLLMGDAPAGYNNAETTTYLASLTTALSDTQATNIDQLITMLKDSLSIASLSEQFDVIYLLANETDEAGLKNLVKRTNDADTVGSVAFTAWQGFTGDQSTGYITTNYNPTTDAVILGKDDNAHTIYSRTATDASSFDFGLNNGTSYQTYLAIRYNDGNHLYGTSNSISSGAVTATNTDGRGFYIMSRDSAGGYTIYKNGSSVEVKSSSSVDLVDGDMYFLGRNRVDLGAADGLSPRQISFFSIGKGLPLALITKFNNCIEWYMDEIGVGVQ